MKNYKNLIVLTLIILTAAASFLLPKTKYTSPDILGQLRIPEKFHYWASKDVSAEFNPNDLRYNFISRVFARQYVNKYKQYLTFLILDAGNFHNPKVCYGSSGYKSRDLDIPRIKIKNRALKATAVFFEKPGESCVIVYWITINKKPVDWTGQKLLQLWYSLFNKEKAGLMVRLDIPATPQTVDSALKLAQEFISQIASQIPPDQQDYLFGK
ncbi:MAG: exosortase C-terminal domain/associated protein EpsI [bacterium]